MIKQFLKKSFWDIMDNIFEIIKLNLLVIFLFSPFIFSFFINFWVKLPFFLYLSIIIFLGIITFPVIGGMFYLLPFLIKENKINLVLLFKGYKIFFRRINFIFLLNFCIAFIILFNSRFYLFFPLNYKIIGGLIFAFSLWVWIFFLLCQNYSIPLLVQIHCKIKDILKYTFFLTLNNLRFSIFIGLFILTISILSILGGIGVFLLIPIIALLQHNATLIILKQYKLEEPFTLWKEIFKEEEEKKRYNRSLKSLFQPWKH